MGYIKEKITEKDKACYELNKLVLPFNRYYYPSISDWAINRESNSYIFLIERIDGPDQPCRERYVFYWREQKILCDIWQGDPPKYKYTDSVRLKKIEIPRGMSGELGLIVEDLSLAIHAYKNITSDLFIVENPVTELF